MENFQCIALTNTYEQPVLHITRFKYTHLMNAVGELQLMCSPPLFKEDAMQRWWHYILNPSPNLVPDTERVWRVLAPAEQYYSHIIAQIFCAWVNLKGDPTKISPQSPLSPALSKYRCEISAGGTKYTGVTAKPERIMGMMCWTHATGEDLNFYGLTAQYHTPWLMSNEGSAEKTQNLF